MLSFYLTKIIVENIYKLLINLRRQQFHLVNQRKIVGQTNKSTDGQTNITQNDRRKKRPRITDEKTDRQARLTNERIGRHNVNKIPLSLHSKVEQRSRWCVEVGGSGMKDRLKEIAKGFTVGFSLKERKVEKTEESYLLYSCLTQVAISEIVRFYFNWCDLDSYL